MRIIKLKEKYSDAELVKGVYEIITGNQNENNDKIGQAFFNHLKEYYINHFHSIKIDDNAADMVFQMAMERMLVNIKMKKIYVNDENELIGTNGQPFSAALTSYFMNIAKNCNHEWLRLWCRTDDKPIRDLPDMDEHLSHGGASIPYEKTEKGKRFWFINGVSTGVEVKKEDAEGGVMQIPYIGADAHWWIDDDGYKKNLGAVYSNMLYDDQEIRRLTMVAQGIAKMQATCKRVLTLFYYFEKSYDEILPLMPNFSNKESLKSRKNNCLKQLREYTNDIYCK